MSVVAWGLATGGAVVAALAAVADGALLSEPPLSSIPVERSTLAPPAPVVPRPVPSRERTHRALAFARVLGHLAAGSGIAVGLDLSGRATLSTVALLFGLGLVVVLAAETTARVVGDALGEDAEDRLAWFSNGAEKLFAPVVRLGNWVDAAFAEVVSDAEATIERREEAAAQFREVITSEADVSRDERDLLLGVFEFGETTVEEVMVPRVDIVGIEQETAWSEMLDRVRSAQHSRVPVFEDTIDEIVGILYVKDLLPSVLADEEPDGGWQTLLRPPAFIPPSKRIADLLREFRVAGRHIAVVADEYGGTAGLVTIEDVLEELVGEIRDEYDQEERQVESEDGVRFWVSGRLTLDDLSEALSHDFRRDDVSTVGGLVLELLGRVPRAGETLAVGPFKVIVERVVRRKIERVYLERVHPLDTSVGES
ncbi:hemolysin family protein [Gemmatimonas groenlandica]|uniref:HlyC/CorC family transporter n=1 Tax=Gemmatimonas groenlandica TaxID=2732249 RepID=A0A6M4INE6_9BACT|nr:hemolysin family protein [Gemmatimonas groenlandica]QJR34997.1 HlyC/CorC family transporter [Gemmatimonas groenlandica]